MYRIIGADGRQYGPVNAEQLRRWIAEGRANAQTQILAEGATDWKPLGTFPEFAGHFAAQPPPPINPITGSHLRATNAFATWGMIFGILAVVCCCPKILFGALGLVFSLIGLSQINERPDVYEGRGFAIAGIVLSVLGILFALFGWIILTAIPNFITRTIIGTNSMAAPSQSIPPKIAARPSLGLFAVAALAFATVSGAAILFFFDPTKNNFYPICQFHLLTGLYCPGCGATRATYQLLHGNFMVALHDNALYVASLAALAVRGVWFLKRRHYHQPVGHFIPPTALWVFLGLALVFVVLRNLPAFSFLAPVT